MLDRVHVVVRFLVFVQEPGAKAFDKACSSTGPVARETCFAAWEAAAAGCSPQNPGLLGQLCSLASSYPPDKCSPTSCAFSAINAQRLQRRCRCPPRPGSASCVVFRRWLLTLSRLIDDPHAELVGLGECQVAFQLHREICVRCALASKLSYVGN